MKTLILALCLSISPAFADSIVQFSGDQFCKGQNRLDNPEVPAGAVSAVWIKYNGDNDTTHYKIVSGVLTHIPSGLTAPNYGVIDTASFKAAIISDIVAGSLSPNWAQYLPSVADAYAKNPAKAKAFVAAIIASPPAWMTSPAGQMALVKQRAVEANMALQ